MLLIQTRRIINLYFYKKKNSFLKSLTSLLNIHAFKCCFVGLRKDSYLRLLSLSCQLRSAEACHHFYRTGFFCLSTIDIWAVRFFAEVREAFLRLCKMFKGSTCLYPLDARSNQPPPPPSPNSENFKCPSDITTYTLGNKITLVENH